MLCGKPGIWQKRLSIDDRKRNLNRSGKPGQNPFPNMNDRSHSILLRKRENIRLFLRNRAIHHRASHR